MQKRPDITAIVSDSMVKYIYGWELSDNYEKVAVKQFSRSTTEDMMIYTKPPLKCNHDRFIIHVGKNDLKSDQDHETCTSEIKNVLTFYWSAHENILLMGDFNSR